MLIPRSSIRRLSQVDIPDCLHIVKANWGKSIAQQCSVELGQAFGSSTSIFYVAKQEHAVLGFAGYSMSSMNYGIYNLNWVDVDPEHQGKGIGKALVNECMDDISAVGSLIMLCTTIPEYYEKWWKFKRCFTFADTETVMWLDIN